jgi:hypothetical protein
VKPWQWLLVAGWFLLAGYVIFRCVTETTSFNDLVWLFAAWLGGVLSLACVEIATDAMRQRRPPLDPNERTL